ncbi:MAG: Snf7 family protein [Candidatus Bathyarchaeota archaeon]|jgi:division protein CdvB (Snf7/Vps24/ESCRT-III family)|nr:Snf7 family protein [Candidatus Bathyarchaeota archaeon]
MADIFKTWESSTQPSTFSKITNAMRKPQPLREKISFTIYKLKVQQGRLEQAYQRMQKHYNGLFRRCTNSVLAKDSARAAIYANECAEIRKMCQTILRGQFAIEQVVLRLETVEEFGDIAVEMNPVANVINSIKGNLQGVVPEVSYRLGEIGTSLNDLVMDSGRVTASSWNVITSGEAADKILEDANAIAEQKMKEKFPTLPTTTLPSLEKSN